MVEQVVTDPKAAQREAFRRHLHDEALRLHHRLTVSATYHQKRARFFDLLDKTCSGFAVIGSASAIAHLADPTYLAAAVAIVSTFGLVGGLGAATRRHSQIARDFRRLLGEVQSAGDYPCSEVLLALKSKCAELEAEEPAVMRALMVECENQYWLARTGRPMVKQPLLHRLLKHWIDFNPPVPPEASPVATN